MSNLVPFSFESHQIRVLSVDGEPWFVATDVAKALEYSDSTLSNVGDAIKHVPEEWKGRFPIPTLGGQQALWCLSEPGFYFFCGRSDKPKALPFQRWAAGEVFPSIRKTGRYTLPGTPPPSGPAAELAAQLAQLLAGKVLVDGEVLADLLRYVHLLNNTLDWIRPLHQALDAELAQPPIRSTSAKPRTAKPQPPRQPVDPLEAQVQDLLATRSEVTSGEVLRGLGIAPELQTQTWKNRVSKILKNLGFFCVVMKQGTRPVLVYRRAEHG